MFPFDNYDNRLDYDINRELQQHKQIIAKLRDELKDAHKTISQLQQQIYELTHENTEKLVQSEIAQSGWTQQEREKFIEALCQMDKAKVKHIELFIKTKTARQITSHKQKFYGKLEKIRPDTLYTDPNQQLDSKQIVQGFKFINNLTKEMLMRIIDYIINYKNNTGNEQHSAVYWIETNCNCWNFCKIKRVIDYYGYHSIGCQYSKLVRLSPEQIFVYIFEVCDIAENNLKFAVKYVAEQLHQREEVILINFHYVVFRHQNNYFADEHDPCQFHHPEQCQQPMIM